MPCRIRASLGNMSCRTGGIMPISFQGEIFASRIELLNRVQWLRDRYAPGERLSGAHQEFVAALFAANPGYPEKSRGRCVSHFEVRAYKFQTRAFFVFFTDGSIIDFSFKKSIECLFGGKCTERAA